MPKQAVATKKKQQDTKEAKKNSNKLGTLQESFIIYMILLFDIPLYLRRKTKENTNGNSETKKKPKKTDVENIVIDKIGIDDLQKEVDRRYEEWQSGQTIDKISETNYKLLQRDKDKTRLNITFNVLLETLRKIMGPENVKTKIARQAKKIIPRERLIKCCDYSKDYINAIGECVNKWLEKYLEIPQDKTKMESVTLVTKECIPFHLLHQNQLVVQQESVINSDFMEQGSGSMHEGAYDSYSYGNW